MMADASKIEWCDATFNPWWGCAEVSPGCSGGECYARTLARRYGYPSIWPAKGAAGADRAHEFRFLSDGNWAKPLKWAKLAREGKLPDGTKNLDGHRPRIFTASMADVFEDRPELEEPRMRLFELISETPQLDWLVLTKRPDVARAWIGQVFYGDDFTREFPNVWMGTSIENARFTWRADVLREIPAAVRFISAEPLLGSLYETTVKRHGTVYTDGNQWARQKAPLDLAGIDWVIIGGSSGPRAKPFHLEHAREIIRGAQDGCTLCAEGIPRVLVGGGESWGYQPIWWHADDGVDWSCKAHGQRGPAVFVKQLGTRVVGKDFDIKVAGKGGDMETWPADLRIREFPRSAVRA